MSDAKFPYVNHMNISDKPLELIDVTKPVKGCKDKWHNQTLCKVNDSIIRLGIISTGDAAISATPEKRH